MTQIPLTASQIIQLQPLLKEAYMTSGAVFGEVRRDSDGVYFIVGVVKKGVAFKVQKALNPP